ncbi:hypothetical protein [Sporosarcina trichiuri]|uniref:hypothetical protein n=1 Tax=Sporosarcina trichiuri TaxID=3056445 RepID=UPI0025B50CE6|nr:hypothetical protein [Sporosarcina sp. 0.2-SM1T-5]WJY26432.1 hypothetical protein QWT68_10095 [Sporosarcina sp. 0.2-SM1T-5]
MNKKLKIFLIAAIVIILAGGSYLLYEFKFKTYDVADEAVDEIIDEPYELDLPDGSTIGDEEAGSGTGTEDGTSGDSSDNSATSTGHDTAEGATGKGEQASGGTTTETKGKVTVSKNLAAASSSQSSSRVSKGQAGQPSSNAQKGQAGNSKPSGSNPQSGGKASVASIKAKYRPTLESLENQAAGRLNALVGRAKSEYAEKSKSGDVSYGYFYNKYMGAARSMEAQTDGAFNTVMGALENELKANGYDKSYAQSFRSDYEARKKGLQSQLMNKALGR